MPPPNDITINWQTRWFGQKRPGDCLAAFLGAVRGVGNNGHFGTVRTILIVLLDATSQQHRQLRWFGQKWPGDCMAALFLGEGNR